MDGTIAEIRLFAGDFAPRNWQLCNGQILSIASNTALFSLLGTTYGGNGTTTFGLPDLRGRAAVGAGSTGALPNINLGELGGQATVTLTIANLAPHTHGFVSAPTVPVSDGAANTDSPVRAYFAPVTNGYSNSTPNTSLPISTSVTVLSAGNSTPYNNMKPFLSMHYIICQFGIFPSRN